MEHVQTAAVSHKDPSLTPKEDGTVATNNYSPKQTHSLQEKDRRSEERSIPPTEGDKTDSTANQPLSSHEIYPAVSTSNRFSALLGDCSSEEPSSSQNVARVLQSQSRRPPRAQRNNSTSRMDGSGNAATLPALSWQSRHILHQLKLSVACRQCYSRNGPKLSHSSCICEGNLLLCQRQHKDWVIIRQQPKLNIPSSYKICYRIQTANYCVKGDDCTFCHSAEEQYIWNAEKCGRFDRKEICRHLRRDQDLPHELPRPSPQPTPAMESFQIVHKRTRKRTLAAGIGTPEARQCNGSQASGDRNRSLSSAPITEKDKEEHRKLMSNVGGCFFAFCETCFDSAPPVMSQKSAAGNHCTSEEKHPWINVTVHALITAGKQQYLKIRSGTHSCARLCRRIVKQFGCWQGDSCQYAHNKVEMEVWKCPVRQEVIVKLCAPAFVHRMQYDVEGDDNHRTSRRVVLFSDSRGSWLLAQGRPLSLERETAPVLCGKGAKCREDSCTDPHSDEELKLWVYMGQHNLSSLDDVMYIASLSEPPKIQPYCCTYCSQHFEQIIQLKQHLRTFAHRSMVDSDREKDWQYRKPPSNVRNGNYELCGVVEGGMCLFGSATAENNSCTKAHSLEELDEWKARYQYRVAKTKMVRDRCLHSYMGDLLSLHEAGMDVFKEELPDVDVDSPEELDRHLEIDSTPGSRIHTCKWTFSIKSTNGKPLKEVGLLFPDPHDNFYLSKLAAEDDSDKLQVYPGGLLAANGSRSRSRIQVVFTTQMLGSFSQWVVFNFGSEPVLYRRLQVDVGAGDLEVPNVPNRVVLEPWNCGNSCIVKFTDAAGTATVPMEQRQLIDRLLERYPPPTSLNRRRDNGSDISETLTRDNYRQVMHRMLYLEEKDCTRRISRFATSSILNVSSKLQLPDGMHLATDGHVFAGVDFKQALLDDSATSQIIAQSVQNILLKFDSSNEVYEAAILPNQTFGSGFQTTVYVKLSKQCVSDQRLLTDGSEKSVTVQLQLQRMQFCLKHFAVDQLKNMDMVLPSPSRSQQLQGPLADPEANPKQELVVDFIRTRGGQGASAMPGEGPLLLCGPFGTGKTYTLAKAVEMTLKKRPQCKVLICAHSNSAADWFITKYLHSFVQKCGANMIRIYATYRQLSSIKRTVRPYLLTDTAGNIRLPTEEDVRASQVVVTTLTTAVHLVTKESLRGCFSHILIDEAGQVLEAEVLMPLAMATEDTCVVLAGDHIQMSPKIFSEKIRRAGLNKSLLERLFLAKARSICLTENYRACQPIVDFIAKTYYGQAFRAKEHQTLHGKFYPLMFSVVKGIDKPAGKSYVNTHEVLEVVRRVKELAKDWPKEWGPCTDADSIGVITPCIVQAVVIRDSLRKERLGHVTVESVDNVQGKEFRAVVISTVRTCKSLKPSNSSVTGGAADEKGEYYNGFLSDPKVLNTAFTRTRSLLIVVGDAAALCSLGSCSTKWRKYLRVCQENGSLLPLGTNLSGIQAEVRDACQTLNPNAAPFQPATRPEVTEKSGKDQEIGWTTAAPQQVPDDPESSSEEDSWFTDDDDSEIEDAMLAEYGREAERYDDGYDVAAHTHGNDPDSKNTQESIAKVPQDGHADAKSIAKVRINRPQDGHADPESIAKVHINRPQDGHADADSIAKVHINRPQDGHADPESIAKVHINRPQDGHADADSIAKVHINRPQDGHADPESIAKVHINRPQDGQADADSIAKVHINRPQDGHADAESIAKVHINRSQDGQADADRFAKVEEMNFILENPTPYEQHSMSRKSASNKGQTNQERASSNKIPNRVQSSNSGKFKSESQPEIKMKPGHKSCRKTMWKRRDLNQVGLHLRDSRDRSTLEAASDFEGDVADEQWDFFKMTDEETRREGLRRVQSEPDKYKICSFRFESTIISALPKGETSSPQIYISGWKNRGQALDLDEVVVEILKSDDYHETDESAEKKTYGKVICILKRTTNPTRKNIVCTLDEYTDTLMVPKDRTFPKLCVKSVQREHGVSPDYVSVLIATKLANTRRVRRMNCGSDSVVKVHREERQRKLFVVKYLQWEEGQRYPSGCVTEELPVGDNIDDGLLVLKHTHGIRDAFPTLVDQYVKTNFPKNWQIPEEEVNSRKDLRSKLIFTVDHPKTLDIDDALSIEEKDGGYEVGIHIADVSHFVEIGSPLDQEARDRAVSFYPSFSKPVDMLPSQLSTNLCSLLGGQDRLAISVTVTMTKEASVTDVRFELTVIQSKERITYDQAELMITAAHHEQEETVRGKVRLLSQLANIRRRNRLRDGCHAFSHDAEEEELCHPLASSMVEEMMLIANEEVSKFCLRRDPKLTPLRSQLPPDSKMVDAWLDSHQEDIPNSLSLQSDSTLDGEGRDTVPHKDVFILKSSMEKLTRILSSAEKPPTKLSKITDIICSDENHPQLAVAQAYLHSLQERASYRNSSEYKKPEAMKHHSLRMPSYTHFTSPIRRYIDVVVQRQLKAAIRNTGQDPYTTEELSLICHHCTNQGIRAKRFERECASLRFAVELKEAPRVLPVYVGATGVSCLQLVFPYRRFIPRAAQYLSLQHLNPAQKLEEDTNITLEWKVRLCDRMAPPVQHVRAKSKVCTEQFVKKISARAWQMILEGIKNGDVDSVQRICDSASDKEDRRQALAGGTSQQVAEISQRIDTDGSLSPFAEFSRGFKQSDVLQVQLHACLVKGVLEPRVQHVSLTATVGCCTEHWEKPVESFGVIAKKRAAKCKSIQQYQNIWLPITEVMSVHNAVHSSEESLLIRGVKISWDHVQPTGAVGGRINLPAAFCKQWHIRFNSPKALDDKHGSDDSSQEGVSQETDVNLDYLCIRYTDLPIPKGTKATLRELGCKSSGMQSQRGTSVPEKMPFVAHAAVTDVRCYRGNQFIDFVVKTQSSSFPRILLASAERFSCVVEVIPKLEQDRRLENAVRELERTTPLIQNICLLKEQPIDMSIGESSRHDMDTPYGLLNQSQRVAVSQAIQRQFTVIHGPPGTGKSIVGTKLASVFTEMNKTSSLSGKRPHQLLYCGPSNESVNVIGGYLKKFPLKVVRVYSETLERQVFPIPGNPAAICPHRTGQVNKMDAQLDDIALHHLIRGSSNSHSETIRGFDQVFSNCNYRACTDEIRKYKREIAAAEEEELTKHHVVLCTCNLAGSRRIKKNVRAAQCIIDEAGMCSQPETLVPLTATNPEKVVLIGDHKQLRSIATATLAKELGMETSLMEEYQGNAIMLNIQYRMHESICRIPSAMFYNNNLETAGVVGRRVPEPALLQRIWPKGKDFRNVFCHVEGTEEMPSATAAGGNENSKANRQEVDYVVKIVSNLIVKRNVGPERILVLSQYQLQCTKIRNKMAAHSLKKELQKVKVSTVITSQGSERDYVVLSTVRSLPRQEIEEKPNLGWKKRHLGFIMDDNQINVALTRAKEGLIIVGNQWLLQVHDIFSELLAQYRQSSNNECAVLNASTFVRRLQSS